MELIPILSTIILVATISTFLLAIGAYVLYKARERKGQSVAAPRQAEVRAEIVSPAAGPAPKRVEQQKAAQQQGLAGRQPVILQQQAQPQKRYAQKPQAYTSNIQKPASSNIPQPGQYNEAGYVQQRGFKPSQYSAQQEELRKQHKDSKFMKYTTEGYVSAKDNKESGAAKWR
jgi:hypothetical protein